MTTHPKREYTPEEIILRVLTALDIASGDSDPNIDPDMTDDEVRSEYPVVWSMQQLTSLASKLAAQRREGWKEPTGFSVGMILDEANNWARRETGKQMLLNYAAFMADQDREVSP
jgi:hypothetical protein